MSSAPLTNVDVRYMINEMRQQVFDEFSHLPIGATEPALRVTDVLDEIVRLRAKVQWLEGYKAATEET